MNLDFGVLLLVAGEFVNLAFCLVLNVLRGFLVILVLVCCLVLFAEFWVSGWFCLVLVFGCLGFSGFCFDVWVCVCVDFVCCAVFVSCRLVYYLKLCCFWILWFW